MWADKLSYTCDLGDQGTDIDHHQPVGSPLIYRTGMGREQIGEDIRWKTKQTTCNHCDQITWGKDWHTRHISRVCLVPSFSPRQLEIPLASRYPLITHSHDRILDIVPTGLCTIADHCCFVTLGLPKGWPDLSPYGVHLSNAQLPEKNAWPFLQYNPTVSFSPVLHGIMWFWDQFALVAQCAKTLLSWRRHLASHRCSPSSVLALGTGRVCESLSVT